MSDAPPSTSRSARSDLPLPGRPVSSTPAPPIATAVAWTSSVSRGGGGLIGDRARFLNRHPGEGRGPWRYPKEIGTFGPDIAAHRPRSAGLSVPARVSPAARWTPAFAGVTE